MTRLRPASSADRTNERFCERCGNQTDPATTLSRVGLTTCRSCGLHACQRCWARSVGWCPACGVSMVAMPLQRSLPSKQRQDSGAGVLPVAAAASTLAARPRRNRLPAFVAAGAAFVVAATAFAFVSGFPLRPTGGVAGATGTPGAWAGWLRPRGSTPSSMDSGGIRHESTGTVQARRGRGPPGRGQREPGNGPGGSGGPPHARPDGRAEDRPDPRRR
jgi:hypothetical protein